MFIYSEYGNSDKEIPKEVRQVLEEFTDVFQEPKSLPPQRTHDHHIPLKIDTYPFTIRPNRYPQFQKDEIEKVVKEMLESGIIQPSQSPFTSPILLVKKKMGVGDFCGL